MKIVKTASGKKTIKMSKKEWQSIGRTAGWSGSIGPGEYDIKQFEDNKGNLYSYMDLETKGGDIESKLHDLSEAYDDDNFWDFLILKLDQLWQATEIDEFAILLGMVENAVDGIDVSELSSSKYMEGYDEYADYTS